MARDLKSIVNLIKKPALHFGLILGDTDSMPKLDSYFGGSPYIISENDIVKCDCCKQDMQFVFQFLIPEKVTKMNLLYSFYFCFDCVHKHNAMEFGVNVYRSPSFEKMMTDSKYTSKIPYCDIRFAPAYEIPEWGILETKYPEAYREFEVMYGAQAIDVYQQAEMKIREYLEPTGFKYGGYTNLIPYNDIPLCPKTNVPMEPFIHMESLPEIGLVWGEGNPFFILFKSPTEFLFDIRIFTLGPVEKEEDDDDDDDDESMD